MLFEWKAMVAIIIIIIIIAVIIYSLCELVMAQTHIQKLQNMHKTYRHIKSRKLVNMQDKETYYYN